MADARLIESPSEFLAVLQKSRLVKPEELKQLSQAQATEAAAIARFLIKKGRLTKWQASQLLSGVANLWIEHYQLRDQLGRGEFGSVYLARNNNDRQQEVALLILSNRHAGDAALTGRFTTPIPEGSAILAAGPAGSRYFAIAALPSTDGTTLERAVATFDAWLKDTAPIAIVTNGPAPSGDSRPADSASQVKIDVGKAPSPVEIDPGSLSISTKRRKKKAASAPAAQEQPEVKKGDTHAEQPRTEAVTEPHAAAQSARETSAEPAEAEPVEPAEAAPTRRSLSRGLIIGASAASLLLLGGVLGIAWWLLAGGEDQQVASAASRAAPTGAIGSASVAGSQQATTGATTDGASDVLQELGMALSTENTTQGASTGASGLGTPIASAQPALSPPAVVSSPPPSTPLTAPAAATAPASAPPLSEPAPETPAPAPATTDAPVSETEAAVAPPEQPAKPAPPPKVFVFESALDLPAPGESGELVLGQVLVGPDDNVFINLSGGASAARGRYEFALQNAQNGLAPRDWEIYLSGGSNADPILIATLALPQQELKFTWSDAAKENNLASNLRNCSLKITAGSGEPQGVALRKPQLIAPLPIDLEKPVVSAKWRLEGAPDPSSLRLEVAVQGAQAAVEPPQLPLEKGATAEIVFGENREQAALLLKLNADITARGLEVKLAPFFLMPLAKEPLALNKKNRGRFAGLGAERARIEAAVVQLRNASNQQQEQGRLGEGEQQLQMITQAMARLDQLDRDYAAVHGKASLQLRVFAEALDQEINLLVTDPNAPPEIP